MKSALKPKIDRHEAEYIEHQTIPKKTSLSSGAIIIAALILLAILYVVLPSFFANSFLPNVSVNNYPLNKLDKNQAIAAINDEVPVFQVTLTASQSSIASSSTQLGLKSNTTEVVEQAWKVGKEGSHFNMVSDVVRSFFSEKKLRTQTSFDQIKLINMISQLKLIAENSGELPHATLSTSGSSDTLVIHRGIESVLIDEEATRAEISSSVTGQDIFVVAQMTAPIFPLTDSEMEVAKDRATKFVGTEIAISDEYSTVTLSDKKIVTLLSLPQGFSENFIEKEVATIAEAFNRTASDATFEYDKDTLDVTTFIPGNSGITLDKAKARQLLLSTLRDIQAALPASNSSTASVETYGFKAPVSVTEPAISLASTNDLGINELIGKGESQYAHSVPNRVFNVAYTSKKISNHLIKPGEEFSFNKTVGPVSIKTGFKQAHIIINGRTELGDGGGVCQVSTTLFRAVLDAGLKVTKRLPHSYRVSYYEQDSKPGIDATVYSGEVDLRFMNDTGHYILVQAATDDEKMEMEVTLYGTADGRYTELVDHKTWGYSPALPTQYFPDPSLQPGQLVKIDNANPGINASYTNIIYNPDGTELRRDNYVSKYKPWAAKYRQGV